jgi:hypothetical protein
MSVFKYFKIDECPDGYKFNRHGMIVLDEMVMKTDDKLPNLKVPVDGPKGVSKFMRRKNLSTPVKKDTENKPTDTKEDMDGMSQKSGDKRSTDSGAGMTPQGVAKYNNRTGGDLKTAVTTPPSKLKKGSKAAGRRKSFCARSKSWNGERGKAARARWNC